MKKYFAVVLAVLLVFLTACGNMSTQKCDEDVMTFGEAETRDPLRICVDLGGSNMDLNYEAMREFESALKGTAGLTDFVIEYVPSPYMEGGRMPEDLSVRASAIDRLRVEILSGNGPDEFSGELPSPPECLPCPHREQCRGGARCQSYAAYGVFDRADPGCPLRDTVIPLNP